MPTPTLPTDSLLVADFEHFLRYLQGKPNLPLTPAGELKWADLWAINQGVNYVAPAYVTNRSRMAEYPLLSFFFEVVTSSRLFVVAYGKTPTLLANAARLDTYLTMTREEKYVFLLETAWCYVDWSAFYGDGRGGYGANWLWEGLAQLLRHPVGTLVPLSDGRGGSTDALTMRVPFSSNNYVRVGAWLGWYDLREIQRAKRDKYAPDFDQITLIEWGQQCLTVLLRERPFHQWNKHAIFYSLSDDDDDKPVNINTFANVFRTYFGESELVSLYPINLNPPTGTYLIRVDLPAHKVSRTLAMPATYTLDALHGMIQQAVDFDNDHLYGFYFNLRNPYDGEQYYDPRMTPGFADGYPAETTTLASLNLYEGQRFLYKFDFGAGWEFTVTVVGHLPNDEAQNASIIEQKGTSPEQYESEWDDDDD